MTDIPVKIVVDLSKPEGEREQVIPLTEEEITQMKLDAEQAKKDAAAQAKAEAATQAARESALAKLQELGLTEAEIKALAG